MAVGSVVPRIKAAGKSALIVAGMTVLVFVLIEGASSLVLLVNDLARYGKRPLTAHSHFDPLLGWASTPNVSIRDLYGPGASFHTNSQGFRNARDFPVEVPPGKIRVVCSGDSFTLGHGVGDDEAWCQVLASLDPRLETVNMGQGGYGLDQAYLWYARDGTKLRKNVLLFAFITEDFLRVAQDNFVGYAKPVLGVRDGKLVPVNVPLPKRSYYLPWLTRNAGLFYRLRSLQLLQGMVGRSPAASGPAAPDLRRSVEIASRIFGELQRSTREEGASLALVYLPVLSDYSDAASDRWRDFVRKDAERRGIPFIDVVEEMRKLPPDEARRLFKDHFSVEGNRFVARTISVRLETLPGFPSRR